MLYLCQTISMSTLKILPFFHGREEAVFRYFRNRLELTQEQVASRAGISTKYLSLIESAAFCNPPTLEVLFDLSDALEIEPYRIFKEL